MDDMWYFVMSYAAIIIFGIFIFNFITNGFLLKYIKVKASRGAKQLVFVHAVNRVYFAVSEIKDGFLKYKNKSKAVKTLKISREKNPIRRLMSVDCVDVDEEKDTFLDKNFNEVEGYNTESVDDYYNTALNKPSIKQSILEIIIIIGIIVVLIAVGYDIMQGQNIMKSISATQTLVKTAAKIAANNTIVVIG